MKVYGKRNSGKKKQKTVSSFLTSLNLFLLDNISVTFFFPLSFLPYSVLITCSESKISLSFKVRESVIAFDLQSIMHALEYCINNTEV